MRAVPAKGPIDSPFVIVGEAPGVQEMKQGLPFVGPSGLVLNTALELLDYPEPYVTNVVPHMINVAKDPAVLAKLAIDHRSRVLEEVTAHPRKVILALGAVALWALTGDTGYKITQVRGKLFNTGIAERGIVATTHPAYLLRGNGSFRQFKADVAYATHLANGGEPHSFTPPTWSVIRTPEEAEELLQKIDQHKGIIACDIETHMFSFRSGYVLMSGITLDGKHVYVIPGLKREYRQSGQMDMHPLMARMWNNPNVKWCWHNGKFDIKFFWHQYNQPARVDEDTMLMSYAMDETRGIHDLETVSADWLGSPNWKGVLDTHKPKKNSSYDLIPLDVLVKYMCFDIANTYNLAQIMRPLVAKDAKQELLYTKTLIPASEYLARIERNGMLVDLDRVNVNKVEYQAVSDNYNKEINDISIKSGYGPINPNSPIQLSDLMYNTLKLPSKTGKGTDQKTLDKLPEVPIVLALKKYRKNNKALTTYVTPAEEYVDNDGRVHPSYLLHGTATGRLACRDPNLQNIPREPKLRGQFIPREGYCFMEVDLNQAELRSLAALSGDDELCRIYSDPNSKGLHEELRRDLFGMKEDWSPNDIQRFMQKWYADSIERIVEEQKMRCKNVNFGIVYGITPFGLSEQIEDSVQEATRMLNGWAKKFPKAWAFINACRNAPLHGKNLVTVFGHKKRFTIVTPETLVAIQNEAANFPHQSTASTITIHGGMAVQDILENELDTLIVNTVHDSVLMEAPLDKQIIMQVSDLVRSAMEKVPVDWGITRIPFKAETKVGNRWGSMKDVNKFFAEQGWST